MAVRLDPSEEQTATTVLRRVSPAWSWVRDNFTLPAMLTIAGIIAAAASYIFSLRTRVTVLEHEVTHIVEVAPDNATLAALRQEVEDHAARISRLENDWDHAQIEAGKDPPTVPRRHNRGH